MYLKNVTLKLKLCKDGSFIEYSIKFEFLSLYFSQLKFEYNILSQLKYINISFHLC